MCPGCRDVDRRGQPPPPHPPFAPSVFHQPPPLLIDRRLVLRKPCVSLPPFPPACPFFCPLSPPALLPASGTIKARQPRSLQTSSTPLPPAPAPPRRFAPAVAGEPEASSARLRGGRGDRWRTTAAPELFLQSAQSTSLFLPPPRCALFPPLLSNPLKCSSRLCRGPASAAPPQLPHFSRIVNPPSLPPFRPPAKRPAPSPSLPSSVPFLRFAAGAVRPPPTPPLFHAVLFTAPGPRHHSLQPLERLAHTQRRPHSQCLFFVCPPFLSALPRVF